MLLTRCPSCRTTFRITTEALEKADGQVRCGRCTRVFDAHEQLHEEGADDAPGHEPRAHAPAAGSENGHAPAAASAAVQSTADAAPAWLPGAAAETHRRRSRWWSVGAAAAALVLAAQVVHHYRTALAGSALVGAGVREAYAALGMTVHPQWDVEQYRVLDWSAAAEPRADGEGSLVITARIRNDGPAAQPFPQVHLQLQDRWQETVGSRVFSPAEYLNTSPGANARMRAGDTADAKLEIVDPGPDAYGFELDVCIETQGATLRCANDAVFR